MLSALRLAALALVLNACSDLTCDTRSVRDIDWDRAPADMGFSAEDFALAFPQRWRAEVLSSPEGGEYPPSIQGMNQDWNWSWQPDRSKPVQHRRQKQGARPNCNIIPLEGRASTLVLPVYFEGSTVDGTWAYAGRGLLVAWALPTAESFPVYWAAEPYRGTEESLQLTRAPREFEEEAATFLGVPQVPAIHLSPSWTLDAFGFHLVVIENVLGKANQFRNGGIIGGGPMLTLAEPLP